MNLTEIKKSPALDEMSKEELSGMITKIKAILSDDYPMLSSYDKAIVQNEDILKVMLGIDFSGKDLKYIFHHRSVEERKLSTPIQELIGQMPVLQSTQLNTGLIRTFLALMINGRVAELYQVFKSKFPEYY